jgi:hypothetical protein
LVVGQKVVELSAVDFPGTTVIVRDDIAVGQRFVYQEYISQRPANYQSGGPCELVSDDQPRRFVSRPDNYNTMQAVGSQYH